MVNILINQPYKQSLTYGKYSKTNRRDHDFPLAIHLLRKVRVGKLAKENVKRFNLGRIQITFLFIFVHPHHRTGREESPHMEVQ